MNKFTNTFVHNATHWYTNRENPPNLAPIFQLWIECTKSQHFVRTDVEMRRILNQMHQPTRANLSRDFNRFHFVERMPREFLLTYYYYC